MEAFRIEISKAQKIIKRFDEVICEKASKFSIDELNDNLKQYLPIKELEAIENRFNDETKKLFRELDKIQVKVNFELKIR